MISDHFGQFRRKKPFKNKYMLQITPGEVRPNGLNSYVTKIIPAHTGEKPLVYLWMRCNGGVWAPPNIRGGEDKNTP